jgi:large subunit ribosomal protein L23
MNAERIYTVLVGPHISEKAVMRNETANQIVLKVAVDATKLEIKKAVEKLFSVKVEKVQVIKSKGKVKRNRYGLSRRPMTKKAYVRLAQGQEVDFAAAE